jgi:hypothetical protein
MLAVSPCTNLVEPKERLWGWLFVSRAAASADAKIVRKGNEVKRGTLWGSDGDPEPSNPNIPELTGQGKTFTERTSVRFHGLQRGKNN